MTHYLIPHYAHDHHHRQTPPHFLNLHRVLLLLPAQAHSLRPSLRQTDLNLMKQKLENLSANVLEKKIIQRECLAIVSEMAELRVVIIQKALMETLRRWQIGNCLQSARI